MAENAGKKEKAKENREKDGRTERKTDAYGEGGTRAAKSAGKPVAALFALYARSSLRRILAVLAGMLLVEGAGFYMVCRLLGQGGAAMYPERMIDLCFLKYGFLTALVLAYFILIVTEGDQSGCRSSYTLLRLRVSKRRQFVVRTVYNFLCLTMVFAVQILAAFAICQIYKTKLPAELVSPQYLFLCFYRNEFLHCILPMADVGKWVCNFLLLLALAMDSAYSGHRNGGGGIKSGENANGDGNGGFERKKGWSGNVRNGILLSLMYYAVLANWFVSGIGSPVALFCALYCAVIIVVVFLRLFGVIGGGSDEEA